MDAYAQPSDVTAVSGSLTSEQLAAIDGLLVQASTKLRGWARERGVNLDTLIEGDELRVAIVKDAVVNATKRALGLLDGFTEITVAIDNFRETKRRGEARGLPDLYIDPADLAGLLPASKKRRFGTLRMGSAL